MSTISGSNTLTSSGAGPTLGQLLDWLLQQMENPAVSRSTIVRIDRSPYINQFDTGAWSVGVSYGQAEGE